MPRPREERLADFKERDALARRYNPPVRIEDVPALHIPYGQVLHDADGNRWVFLGWFPSAKGTRVLFSQTVNQDKPFKGSPNLWAGTFVHQMREKFPEIGPRFGA